MLLTEYDPNPKAYINPEDIIGKIENMPKLGIACFSQTLFQEIIDQFEHEVITESLNKKSLIYRIKFNQHSIALFLSPTGAPACIGMFEELIAMGVEKFVYFGTCGVLNREIKDCSIIIPTAALRDEGTSYHYLEASDEIEVNSKYMNLFIERLHTHHLTYTLGKTWTIDAFFRETKEKVERRKKQGCISVEMECSALAAVAKFRDVDLFQFFYAADCLDGDNWDERSLKCRTHFDKKLSVVVLALELCTLMVTL